MHNQFNANQHFQEIPEVGSTIWIILIYLFFLPSLSLPFSLSLSLSVDVSVDEDFWKRRRLRSLAGNGWNF